MTIHILPYIFKRIGLFLFILCILGQFLMGVFDPHQSDDLSGFPTYWGTTLEIISLIGIILYLISKEKVEDELVQKIRLEAMSASFLITVGVLLLLYLINYTQGGIEANTVGMFYLQLFLFLIIYRYKKRSFSL